MLKVGKSMPRVDELHNGSHHIDWIPIGEQPIQRKGHLISIFPIFPENGAGGIQPPLVMSSQVIDPSLMVFERGSMAWKHKPNIHLPDSGKALKVIG